MTERRRAAAVVELAGLQAAVTRRGIALLDDGLPIGDLCQALSCTPGVWRRRRADLELLDPLSSTGNDQGRNDKRADRSPKDGPTAR